MKVFLRNGRRGRASKKFIGVIGSYLIEILDDDPLIPHILTNSQFKYRPSDASRLDGVRARMVLKSHSNDSLIIFKTKNATHWNEECELVAFVNNSNIASTDLLREAQRLSEYRWFSKKEFIISRDISHELKLVKEGWELCLEFKGIKIMERLIK